MGKKVLFLICYLGVLAALAQPGKEAWHWYFGIKNSLDFTAGAASTGTCNLLFQESCAAISDEQNGQLQFYSEGLHVYNSMGVPMNNGYGIAGEAWKSQSTLIVPIPQSRKYYLFALSYNGVSYSMIDMALQNGLGAVTSVKNKILSSATPCGKITAVRHCNGTDYWVITHPYNKAEFYVYKITAMGIDTVPLVNLVGTLIKQPGNGGDYERGYLKASPNGKKLAMAESDSLSLLEIYDFDNSNGIISNPLTVHFPYAGLPMWAVYYGSNGPYGVSFSPDNSKLYTSLIQQPSIICQLDLSSNNSSTILASLDTIATLPNSNQTGPQFCALQLGPDGKIYIAQELSDSLSVIVNPNGAGPACNFQLNGVPLPPVHKSTFSLPNFIDANYAGIQINIPDVQQCNTFTTTTIDAGPGFTNYFWSTGASTQTISINSPGKYWVTVTNQQGCTRTDTVNAYIITPQRSDTLVCDTFRANVVQNGVLQYNWFDGNHLPIRNFTQSGNYYVDINYVSGCAIRDSLNITIVQSPKIDLGPDTSFCKGDLLLNAQCNTCTYQWSTGESSSDIRAKTPGTYWVRVKDVNGCSGSDTLIVKPELTAFNFAMPNIVTPNGDNINDEINFGKYQFSTFNIEIYNRWGQKVFASEDPAAVWKPSGDEGTYFYVGRSRIDCGGESKTRELKGYITLTR